MKWNLILHLNKLTSKLKLLQISSLYSPPINPKFLRGSKLILISLKAANQRYPFGLTWLRYHFNLLKISISLLPAHHPFSNYNFHNLTPFTSTHLSMYTTFPFNPRYIITYLYFSPLNIYVKGQSAKLPLSSVITKPQILINHSHKVVIFCPNCNGM